MGMGLGLIGIAQGESSARVRNAVLREPPPAAIRAGGHVCSCPSPVRRWPVRPDLFFVTNFGDWYLYNMYAKSPAGAFRLLCCGHPLFHARHPAGGPSGGRLSSAATICWRSSRRRLRPSGLTRGSAVAELRIVSLIASATEIVAALGFGHCLVGRSHECDFPPEVLDLPPAPNRRSTSMDEPRNRRTREIAGGRSDLDLSRLSGRASPSLTDAHHHADPMRVSSVSLEGRRSGDGPTHRAAARRSSRSPQCL